MKYTTTTGNPIFAVRHTICRVSNVGHTAKGLFAVCHIYSTRQTLGTRRTKLLPCVANKTHGKLQPHGKILNPVTPVSYLPCAYGLNPRQTLNTRQTFQTHNEKKNCRVPPLGTRQTTTFAECFICLPCAWALAHGKVLIKRLN